MTWYTTVIGGLILACSAGAAAFTQRELKALYYYDLGPETVDVSTYPKKYEKNYQVFKRVCSQCHTLARPINAPISGRKAWKRYILRMRVRTKYRDGTAFSRKDAEAILNFLEYDSKQRREEGRAGFNTNQRRLKRRFDRALEERMRLLQEESKRLSRQKPMYSGERPNPR